MAGVALAMFATIAIGAVAIYVFLQSLTNFQPGRGKIQKDLAKIRAELQPWVSDLVPWSREELEQLSFNQINKSSRKRMVSISKGIITTIYHEPVIAYAYKRYMPSKENALLYARTSEHEFIYRIKNDTTEIVINNQLVGTVDANGRLFSYKGKKMLAQINRDSEALLLPVQVNEKVVGNLVNPGRTSKVNPRAFELLTGMEKEEESLFLSLSVLEMINRIR
jgi:hypothetical protein